MAKGGSRGESAGEEENNAELVERDIRTMRRGDSPSLAKDESENAFVTCQGIPGGHTTAMLAYYYARNCLSCCENCHPVSSQNLFCD